MNPRKNDELSPKEFVATTPGAAPDTSPWVMKAIGHLEGEIVGLTKQIEGIDRKIDGIRDDVKDIRKENHSHAKWIYAANAIAILVVGLIGFFANKLWDLLLAGINATHQGVIPGH